ncbi:MAG: trypsin-like peptidase domain-containing protein [Symploca sp. SIO3C6]|nr:trypsin-like peptidase domain-containing protein [Symploca sp. SIO3C6]NET04826.1 trypsin-like peptidase domain-containing protein [Symploca sp. SIO2B6]
MLLKQIALKSLGSMLLGCLVANPVLAQLSPEEINSIARQTTVLIAPGLTPELIDELEENRQNPLARAKDPDGVWNPGSGVIIAKEGKSYYVLTVTHNFKQRHLDENMSYGIRTSDGQVHEVTEVNDDRGCPLNGGVGQDQQLLRFGCYSKYLPNRVNGFDLAIVRFESDKKYAVAPLGSPDDIKMMDTVFISGWPDPEKEQDAVTGKCRGRVARRQRRLAWGPVTGKINPAQGQNGYGIFYVDQTRPGMSGGPVFDSNGFVVGVHGRGSADKGQLVRQYCSLPKDLNNTTFESEDLAAQAGGSDPTILHTRFSSAQNLNNFSNVTNQAGMKLSFNRLPPSADFIQAALIELKPDRSNTGTFDLVARDDVMGTFEDTQDAVEDIYDLFQFKLENQLRDEPSAGCGSILLGDERERCKK